MRAKLHTAILQLGLKLDETQVDLLLEYVQLIARWNAAYNLTAIREPDKMLVYHLCDSLAVAPYVGAGELLDVGTGAGLPGVVLAILNPEQPITLLDSNGKKVRFLQHVRRSLALNNLTLCQSRVENLQKAGGYAMIISRAFTELANMIALCAPLLAENGTMLAMKGKRAQEELAGAKRIHPLQDVHIHPIAVPFMQEERNLLTFKLRQ